MIRVKRPYCDCKSLSSKLKSKMEETMTTKEGVCQFCGHYVKWKTEELDGKVIKPFREEGSDEYRLALPKVQN